MSANFINRVMLSGKIGWVKIKYTSAESPFANFTILQTKYQYDKGIVVAQYNVPYFVWCFDSSVWSERTLKEGSEIWIEGILDVFEDKKTGYQRYNILAEKIIVRKDD